MNRSILVASVLLAAAPCAFAAGGHHAVDDAAILEPGQCEVEGWVTRSRAKETLVHAGSGCRVGPVELAVAFEGARAAGETSRLLELQLKYARELAAGWSAGVIVAPFRERAPGARSTGTTALLLATWSGEPFAVHLNAGKDFGAGTPSKRWGAAAEWSFAPQWSATVERYREPGADYARLAARHAFNDHLSLDLGHAWRLRGDGASHWTLGVNYVFER